MTTTEAEWDEDTRNLALALDAVPRCPVCGGDPSVCQDAARQFDWKVPDPTRCHRTTAIRTRQERLAKDSAEHLDALLWGAYLDNSLIKA